MPFKNRAQQKACYAKRARGENGSWDCSKWSKETKSGSKKKRRR